MIPDRFFFWPYQQDLTVAIDDVSPILQQSAFLHYLKSPFGDLAEFLCLECRDWDINPWWLLVCFQREQSGLFTPFLQADALKACMGFVGQDVGRSTRPGYYGIFLQIQRCAAQSSWLLGKREDPRTKSALRYRPGISMTIESEGKQVQYSPKSAGEYLQLEYTPHQKVLEVNETIARKICPRFF